MAVPLTHIRIQFLLLSPVVVADMAVPLNPIRIRFLLLSPVVVADMAVPLIYFGFGFGCASAGALSAPADAQDVFVLPVHRCDMWEDMFPNHCIARRRARSARPPSRNTCLSLRSTTLPCPAQHMLLELLHRGSTRRVAHPPPSSAVSTPVSLVRASAAAKRCQRSNGAPP